MNWTVVIELAAALTAVVVQNEVALTLLVALALVALLAHGCKERPHRNRGFSSKLALGGREPSRDYDDPSKLSTPPNQKPNKG